MSTTSLSSAGTVSGQGLTSGSVLTNSGAGQAQMVGLSSGINTTALIQAEMAVQEAPLTNMQHEISGLGAENTTLSAIQNQLQAVSADAMMLGLPSTFFNVQTISSSQPGLVSAATSNGVGAPVGSATIAVSQLASAAQAYFSYTPPAADETLSISDGVNPAQSLTVKAGTTTAGLASQINHSNSLGVWASVSTTGQLVLSARNTGSQYAISAADTTTPQNLVAGSTVAGQDAQYTLNPGTANAVSGSSPSDTVTGAIPGVTLTLAGVTGSTPVTITAQQPGPDVNNIASMVQQFVTDYNTALKSIEAAVETRPPDASSGSSYDPNSGSLFGDDELSNLIGTLRDSIIAPGGGLPSGMAALSDLGITTGASSGSATAGGVAGMLTIDTSKLQNALSTNPGGVQQVLQEFSSSFQTFVNQEAAPGGSLATRISGNTTLAQSLQSRYTDMQATYAQQEKTMEAEWASVEAAMSNLKNQGTYLTAFASSLNSSNNSNN